MDEKGVRDQRMKINLILHQAFFDLKFDYGKKHLLLRVGRQEMVFGS